jgi:hypothetical protein
MTGHVTETSKKSETCGTLLFGSFLAGVEPAVRREGFEPSRNHAKAGVIACRPMREKRSEA